MIKSLVCTLLRLLKHGRKYFLLTLSTHLTEAPVQLSRATRSRDVGYESHLSFSPSFTVSFQRKTLDTTTLTNCKDAVLAV